MAVIRTGEGQEYIYENFKAGWGKHPEHEELIVLGITDLDNLEQHLFPMTIPRFESLCELGKQTAAGIKIETFGPQDMPTGPRPA